ncbi:MAG: hypothetical protein SOI13_01310 [Bifidobacterium mongoliense]|jgi:hypothetical protein|uniref:hypothetical protein n=1 Tax=Bifidobacterium mongoliense TaxID=518643 RepID=UPI002F359F28
MPSDFDPQIVLVDDILTTQEAMEWLHIGKEKFKDYRSAGVGAGQNVTYLKSDLLAIRRSLMEFHDE